MTRKLKTSLASNRTISKNNNNNSCSKWENKQLKVLFIIG